MPKERLQKVIAKAGIASRRRAEEMILAGRVQVDGIIINTLGVQVDPDSQTIAVDGKLIEREDKVTYVLNKPLGAVSTVSDPQGRLTVRDIVADVEERVYPVGRLDADTSGVLLLTNDGELAFRLTHPSFEVPKVYHALVRGIVQDGTLQRMAAGVELDDGPTAPAKVSALQRRRDSTLLAISIHEGRNRQVRRFCAAVGHPVVSLQRVAFASITSNGLNLGAYRPLQRTELQRVRALVGLANS